MKKNYYFFIVVLIWAAMLATAMVSCQKESSFIMPNGNSSTSNAVGYTPPQVDDMNAYLKDFKQKMVDSRGGETMDVEEAAWHLSSLANYDFGHANVGYSDIIRDTLNNVTTLPIVNGEIAVTNLGSAYNDIHNAIETYYMNLDLDEKHFRLINVFINENGGVKVAMTITYRDLGHVYYFPNVAYADSICELFFDPNAHYLANGLGKTTLENVLNLFEHHSTDQSDRIYYVLTNTRDYYFMNYVDSLGSPFYNSSRLFAGIVANSYEMTFDEMCYCLDSYLGLGYQYCSPGEDPINWYIIFNKTFTREGQVRNHELFVDYGIQVTGGQNDY